MKHFIVTYQQPDSSLIVQVVIKCESEEDLKSDFLNRGTIKKLEEISKERYEELKKSNDTK